MDNNMNRPDKKDGGNSKIKTIILYAVMIAVFIGGIAFIGSRRSQGDKAAYYEVVQYFEQGKVSEYKLNLSNGKLTYQLTDSKEVKEYVVPNVNMFVNDIHESVIKYNVENPKTPIKADYEKGSDGSIWMSLLPTVVLIGIVVLAYFFLIRRMGNAMGNDHRNAMNFSRAKVRNGADQKEKKTFADVAGADEEKEELSEIVRFLKNPQKFNELGARIPKGVLLVGPPGTGKTLLAKAVAGEADAPFLSISGSNFVELYVGVGASRVRDLFEQAKKQAPAIIFIDEIDAVGRHRGAGMGGGHDEREQTLNQLLVEMDGMSDNSGIVVIAATNRPDVLDPALLRPGRFDRQITVSLPDLKGREMILKVHARNKKLADNVDLEALARRTPGFSGADLENVLNEAAILAVRNHRDRIETEQIDEAIDRVMMGPAKKSRTYDEHTKKLVAYHEAGHAIVGLNLPDGAIVQKVTIIPRGNAGGYNLITPRKEKILNTRKELYDTITSYMGGRAAEEIFFDDISTGASGDIQAATRIAKDMVTTYGMSELGPIQYDSGNGTVFLGRDYNSPSNASSQVAYEIDTEVRKIIDHCHAEAVKIIKDNKKDLIKLAEALMARETLTAEEINDILDDKLIVEEGILKKAPEQVKKETARKVVAKAEKVSRKKAAVKKTVEKKTAAKAASKK